MSHPPDRCILISKGQVGVYAGGGFLHDSADAGDSEFGAGFVSTKDDKRARALEQRLRMLMP